MELRIYGLRTQDSFEPCSQHKIDVVLLMNFDPWLNWEKNACLGKHSRFMQSRIWLTTPTLWADQIQCNVWMMIFRLVEEFLEFAKQISISKTRVDMCEIVGRENEIQFGHSTVFNKHTKSSSRLYENPSYTFNGYPFIIANAITKNISCASGDVVVCMMTLWGCSCLSVDATTFWDMIFFS